MTGEEKIDLFKELKQRDYAAPKKPVLVATSTGSYLTIEGRGAPGGEDFAGCSSTPLWRRSTRSRASLAPSVNKRSRPGPTPRI